jgi:hypothetical protein
MGGAIFFVLIGVPIGLFMLLRPRKMWWLFDSWKYKNPEANEPSDAAYAMTAFSGLAIIIGVIFCSAMFWSADNDYKEVIAEQDAKAQAEKARKEAVKNYVAPPAQNRGPLPFVGYTVEASPNGKQRYEIWYLQPPNVYSSDLKNLGQKGLFNCVTHVRLDRASTPVAASANLSWEPTAPPRGGESDKCVVGDLSQQRVKLEKEWAYFDGKAPEIVTDSAIVGPSGNVIVAAKPGNVLPRLAVAPTR